MSILNVNKINPVGGGSTITIVGIASVTNNISVGNSVTANSFHGDGSQLTGIDATKIETGNTKVETVDTGSDGHVKITTEGSERLRIINNGKIFVGAYSAGDDFSDEGTFLNIRNNSYGGRIGFSNNTATAGVEFQVDSWSKLSYSGAEYTFMIGLGTYRQSQKVLVMHDGTTAFSQEYGIMFSPEQQVSIAATVSSNNVLVKVTPEAGISGLSTYRFVKTFIENL